MNKFLENVHTIIMLLLGADFLVMLKLYTMTEEPIYGIITFLTAIGAVYGCTVQTES